MDRTRLSHIYVEPFAGKWYVLDDKHTTLAICETQDEARAWVNDRFAKATAE